MLPPVDPERVFGLPVVVAVLPGPDVFRTPGAGFFGDVSVAERFGAGKVVFPLSDMVSGPFMCALPGRVFSFVKDDSSPSGLSLVFLETMDPRSKQSTTIGTGLTFATGMREPPLWLFEVK
jgi:hypothetical protein